MACPLSLGDILAVSQICWYIGKALTTGRAEAPEKFRGAQSHLYALSEALKSLDAEVKRPDSIFAHGDTADTALDLVRNCEAKLKDLKNIIEKYSGAMENGGASTLKTLKQDLRHNWQRIMWISEEKDLDVLITELTLQTSTINTFILAKNRYVWPHPLSCNEFILILALYSMALGRIETTTDRIDQRTSRILEGVDKLLLSSTCAHVCSSGGRSASVPAISRSSSPQSVKPSTNRSQTLPLLAEKPHNPDGLPFVSEERCRRIDNMCL